MVYWITGAARSTRIILSLTRSAPRAIGAGGPRDRTVPGTPRRSDPARSSGLPGGLRADGQHRDGSDHVARNACSGCPDAFPAPTGYRCSAGNWRRWAAISARTCGVGSGRPQVAQAGRQRAQRGTWPSKCVPIPPSIRVPAGTEPPSTVIRRTCHSVVCGSPHAALWCVHTSRRGMTHIAVTRAWTPKRPVSRCKLDGIGAILRLGIKSGPRGPGNLGRTPKVPSRRGGDAVDRERPERQRSV
jgi:hypothetical protein